MNNTMNNLYLRVTLMFEGVPEGAYDEGQEVMPIQADVKTVLAKLRGHTPGGLEQALVDAKRQLIEGLIHDEVINIGRGKWGSSR